MQKFIKFIKYLWHLQIDRASEFTLAGFVLFVVAGSAFVFNLPHESSINYIKKDVLPPKCTGFSGVEVDGRKYYCFSYSWKELN